MAWQDFKNRIRNGGPNSKEMTINERNIALAQARGEQARQTARESNEFATENMTAYQRGSLDNSRADSSLKQFNSNRTFQRNLRNDAFDRSNKMFDQRNKQFNSNRTFQRNLRNDAFDRSNKMFDQRNKQFKSTLDAKKYNDSLIYSEDMNGNKVEHPGISLIKKLKASGKDWRKALDALPDDQKELARQGRDIMKQLVPVGTTRNGVNTAGWSENRLRRTAGEFGGTGLNVQGPVGRQNFARRPAANQNITTAFDSQGRLTYTNNMKDDAGVMHPVQNRPAPGRSLLSPDAPAVPAGVIPKGFTPVGNTSVSETTQNRGMAEELIPGRVRRARPTLTLKSYMQNKIGTRKQRFGGHFNQP